MLETVLIWGVGIAGAYSLYACKPAGSASGMSGAGGYLKSLGGNGFPMSFYIFNIASVAYWLNEVFSDQKKKEDAQKVVDRAGSSNHEQAAAYRKAAELERQNAKTVKKKGKKAIFFL